MKCKIGTLGVSSLLVICGFVGFLNFGSLNAQGTNVSGTVFDGSGGPWTLAFSPYIVIGNVTVPAGQTLTIEAGVQVSFDGYFSLYVDGNLDAIGTGANRINISSNMAAPAPDDWDKIQINSTGHLELEYADISYANYGIYLSSSSYNNITNSNASNNLYGIYLVSSSNNNTITFNNITNNAEVGINIFSSKYNNVSKNSMSNNKYGIRFGGRGNIVTNNTIVSSAYIGIDFAGIPMIDNILTDNTIKESDWHDLQVTAPCRHVIKNNTGSGDRPIGYFNYSVALQDSVFSQLILCNADDSVLNNVTIDGSDTLRNNALTVLNTERATFSNISSSGNYYGISLFLSSSNSTIRDSILTSNRYGFSVRSIGSVDNTFINNTVTGNDHGIQQYSDSHITTITDNNISSNKYNGISLPSSTYDNTVSNNTISDNQIGISIQSSSGNSITSNYISSNTDTGLLIGGALNNSIYHNSFVENPVQATDIMGSNSWNDTYPSGGNYWSDYSPTCVDIFDGALTPQTGGSPDGICDAQYDIDADSIDYYPIAPPDVTPPIITNLQPSNASTTSNNTPAIGADYSDQSGINVSSVLLEVDGNDVTSSATVTASDVTYTPGAALGEGNHTVYLQVSDIIGNPATATWTFTVNTTTPPPPGDSDDDGLPDTWEMEHFGDLDQSGTDDADNDGLSNTKEYQIGTNPTKADTDGDGVSDGDEIEAGTDPLVAEPTEKEFLSEYWWLILLIIIIVVVVIVAVLLLTQKRKKPAEVVPPEEVKPEAQEEPEESEES